MSHVGPCSHRLQSLPGRFPTTAEAGGGNPMGEEKRKKGRAGRTLFVGGVSCIVFLETMEMYQKCTRDLKRGEGQRSVYVKMVSCTILIDNMYI